MFPIWDSRGEPVGFGGRTLDDQGPKYKNSPETPIYQKSRLLYGLHWAKGEIVARGEVVICEGYTDVMAFVLAGVPNAVATCGTALADDHFLTLKNLAAQGHARVRRRRRRTGRGRALLPVGAAVTRCSSRSPTSRPDAIPADVVARRSRTRSSPR